MCLIFVYCCFCGGVCGFVEAMGEQQVQVHLTR